VQATHTTPESLELNDCSLPWSNMNAHQRSWKFRHALVQHRVHGVRFAAGVFTNLTDHLVMRDHGRLLRAKKILFSGLPADAPRDKCRRPAG
jgi:UDP-N-acetylmuramyl tripeptide synthase